MQDFEVGGGSSDFGSLDEPEGIVPPPEEDEKVPGADSVQQIAEICRGVDTKLTLSQRMEESTRVPSEAGTGTESRR